MEYRLLPAEYQQELRLKEIKEKERKLVSRMYTEAFLSGLMTGMTVMYLIMKWKGN